MKEIILLTVTTVFVISCVTYGPYETNTQPSIYYPGIDSPRPEDDPRSQSSAVTHLPGIAIADDNGLTEVIGRIRVEKLFLHPFFLSIPVRQRDVLRKKALKEAEARYGSEIEWVAADYGILNEPNPSWGFCCVETELANLQYESKLHISSLLLIGFGILGWVEKASLEAVVVRESTTQEILPSYLLYHLASPSHFNLRFLRCCFE